VNSGGDGSVQSTRCLSLVPHRAIMVLEMRPAHSPIVIAVPKSEIDEREKEWQTARKRKRKKAANRKRCAPTLPSNFYSLRSCRISAERETRTIAIRHHRSLQHPRLRVDHRIRAQRRRNTRLPMDSLESAQTGHGCCHASICGCHD